MDRPIARPFVPRLGPPSRLRRLTSVARVLPDFLIIGSMRSGTTSLYRYLLDHPQIVPPWSKEAHYLDRPSGRGILWYRANFPTYAEMHWHRQRHGGTSLTFDATPDYMPLPDGARRLAHAVPSAKLIALLRNPADRAYSHYQFNVHLGRERHSFAKAIRKEADRLAGEGKHAPRSDAFRRRRFLRYSYATRGLYLEQLKSFDRYFTRERILVLKSEDFFAHTQETYDQVLEFLGLDAWTLRSSEAANAGSYARETRPGFKELREFFTPHNQRLYEYLGKDLGW